MDAHLAPRDEFPFSSAPDVENHPTNQRDLRVLLRGLGQELREPLARLRTGFDQLLGEAPQPVAAEHRSHVATIRELCDDLLRMTGGCLEYAEAAKADEPARSDNLTLGAIVAQLDQKFGQKARNRGLTFETVVEAADARIIADAERCARIFDNLIDNAIAYTPSGGRVRIEAALDGDSWVLSVEDDGPGIPADSQAKVFEPFHRLSRDEHSAIPGEGLGLSICRELTAQLRGQIVLRSEADRGTRFTVVLPKHPGAVA